VSFPLAQTGEGISECELMRWLVQVGLLHEQSHTLMWLSATQSQQPLSQKNTSTTSKL
jgi:hypothetical protein